MTATELSKYEMFLQNPSIFVGKCSIDSGEFWTLENNQIKLVKESWASIILKMFDELLMNCLDNFQASLKTKTPMSYINVSIQRSKDMSLRISISNDGKAISLAKTSKCLDGVPRYNPEVIFSKLFSSTHYDKKDENIAGMNGIGAKIATVFSKVLSLTIVNNKVLYEQTFKPTSKEIIAEPPTITKGIDSENITKITFEPDFEKIEGIDESVLQGTLKTFLRRLIDVKLLVNEVLKQPLKIIYNNKEILKDLSISSLWNIFKNPSYADVEGPTYKCRIAISKGFCQYSVVNGITTTRGGQHITKIIEELGTFVEGKLKRKDLKRTLKSMLLIVFVGTCPKPSFTSQDKVELDKGFPNNMLKDKDLQRIFKDLNLGDLILGREREKSTASNSTTAKRLQIKDLTDATYAGTKKSSECVLFLAEGLSALSFAKIGMKTSLDANYFGCYPVGGKILNVRKSKFERTNSNEVLLNIEKILGLKVGSKNDSLRYGKVVILKDADTDGAEIMGLIINFFHYQYPELLKRPFLYEFMTPMIKLYVPNSQLTRFEFNHQENIIRNGSYSIVPFYNEQEFNHFKLRNPSINAFKTDYIKGLAGNEDFEVTHFFKQRSSNEIELFADDKLEETIDVVYGKDSSKRKNWMVDRTERFLDRDERINISDFLNNDVLMFSFENCKRTIPSAIDGLKPSQRKVLWTLLSSKHQNEFKKVFMLTGEVSSFAYYNHGDASMNETIIKMGQTFAGSNNINLVEPSGFFGSREYLGNDHGAARYIKCRLNKDVLKIFPTIDTKLLKKQFEDNVQIEPDYFIPIIPMVLVNGSIGIGTGYSSFVPMFSKDDIRDCVKNWLKTGYFEEPMPKINGFNGIIKKNGDGYIIKGRMECIAKNDKYEDWRISEIPYDVSFADFENVLKELYNKKLIINFEYGDRKKNREGVNSVNYIIRIPPESDVLCDLPMVSKISSKNMTLFNSEGVIRKFDTITDIFFEWATKRYEAYEIRKNFQEDVIRHDLKVLENKLRFINEVAVILKETQDEEFVKKLLEEKHFDMIDKSYDYLLLMPMKQLTKANVEKIVKEIEAKKNELENTVKKTVEEMWLEDLEEI